MSHPLLSRLPRNLPNESFTFAIIGDNRGDSDGTPPAVLFEIIEQLNREAPAFVVSTGDLINAYPEEDEAHLRRLWRGYLSAVEKVRAPVFHIPGNHDVFSELTARLWRELVGPTYFAFDYGGVRVIGLDTETEPGVISGTQFAWLKGQLELAGGRRVFVFLHQPLFPVDGHIGNSLDKYPSGRDALHALFALHASSIAGVFHGHEHLFSLQERDGVRYYISAGSGSPLYVPREIGGYFHYLLVRVNGNQCATELRRVREIRRDVAPVRVIQPGELLEDWSDPTVWFVWDQSVVQERVAAPAKGEGALRLDFNLAQYEWPSLMTEFEPRKDFSEAKQITADIFLLDDVAADLAVRFGFENEAEVNTAPTQLKRGWSRVVCELRREQVAGPVAKFWMTFIGTTVDVVRSVVVDNVQVRGDANSMFAADWKAPLIWGVWADTMRPTQGKSRVVRQEKALEMPFDFARCKRPCVYCELRPVWDLSRISRLLLDVVAATDSAVEIQLALTGEMETCVSPPRALQSNRNIVAIDLSWLRENLRGKIRRMEWWITGENDATGWLIFDRLRVE